MHVSHQSVSVAKATLSSSTGLSFHVQCEISPPSTTAAAKVCPASLAAGVTARWLGRLPASPPSRGDKPALVSLLFSEFCSARTPPPAACLQLAVGGGGLAVKRR